MAGQLYLMLGRLLVFPLCRLIGRHTLAVRWVRAGERKYPTNRFLLLCDLAEHYARSDLDELAERAFESAIASRPEDGFAHAVFGMFLEERGRLAEARIQYESALELGFEDDASDKFRPALQELLGRVSRS